MVIHIQRPNYNIETVEDYDEERKKWGLPDGIPMDDPIFKQEL